MERQFHAAQDDVKLRQPCQQSAMPIARAVPDTYNGSPVRSHRFAEAEPGARCYFTTSVRLVPQHGR